MTQISPKVIDVDGNRVEVSIVDNDKVKPFGCMPLSKVGDGGYDRPWMKNTESILTHLLTKVIS